jgi:hypothetical protein
VSRAITGALEAKLTSSGDLLMATLPMSSIQAYDCYLRVRHSMRCFSPEGTSAAEMLLLQKVIAVTLDFALFAPIPEIT